jgi:hypothetical protein
MAIGLFKIEIINIFIEKDQEKQSNMLTRLAIKISKYYTNTSTKKSKIREETPPRKNSANCRDAF